VIDPSNRNQEVSGITDNNQFWTEGIKVVTPDGLSRSFNHRNVANHNEENHYLRKAVARKVTPKDLSIMYQP